LKEGVEQAARSVLGDDIEALKLAKSELDALSEQARRENRGGQESDSSASSQEGQSQNGQGSREARERQSNRNASAGNEQAQGQREGRAQAQAQGQGERQPQDSQSESPTQQASSGQQGSGGRGQSNQGGNPAETARQIAEREAQLQQMERERGQNDPSVQRLREEIAELSESLRRQQQQQQGGARQGEGSPGSQGGSQQANANANANANSEANASGEANAGGNPNSSPQADGGGSDLARGGARRNFFDQNNGTGRGGEEGPITGSDYRNWSDRLRDVEELLDVPELREEISEVRENARNMRVDYKRHGKEPKWDLVKSQIIAPLAEVRSRVQEELTRRESPESLVPIDRDPVPAKYSELVRRYYEKLGSAE
jgi:hypothetical protein